MVEYTSPSADLPLQWRIIGQLRDTYILLEDNDYFYLVDQHALAERIAYERMKVSDAIHTDTHTLLTPIVITCSPGFLSSQYEEILQ